MRLTLNELKCPNLKVNFDPANMLLYDKGDPLRSGRDFGPDIRSVHVKDANRPTVPGNWVKKFLWPRPSQHPPVHQNPAKVGYQWSPVHRSGKSVIKRQRVADNRPRYPLLKECLA